MLLILLLFTFAQDPTYSDTTAMLVLKNSQKMKLPKPYTIEGHYVLFTNKHGKSLQLPIDKVDLDASAKATEEYHRARKKILFAKPKEVKRKPSLPDTLFSESSTAPTDDQKQFNFQTPNEDSFSDDEDFFKLDEAWELYRKGDEAAKLARLGEKDKTIIQKKVARFSKLIWECKAAEKRKPGVDELTWESQKRDLKNLLQKSTKSLRELLTSYRVE